MPHTRIRKGTRRRARSLRREPTDAETKLWRALRSLREAGLRWRRQAPIGRYIVDFACLSHGLVVEIDGGQHAESRTDPERTAWLQSQGFRVLRFWNSDISENVDGCLAAILQALESGRHSSNPLPGTPFRERNGDPAHPPPQGGRE